VVRGGRSVSAGGQDEPAVESAGAATARSEQVWSYPVVQTGPVPDIMGPMVSVKLERIEALELLGMTLAHLNDAEARGEASPRVPLLMAIRDKLALALREES
jgi:hypothetical protein